MNLKFFLILICLTALITNGCANDSNKEEPGTICRMVDINIGARVKDAQTEQRIEGAYWLSKVIDVADGEIDPQYEIVQKLEEDGWVYPNENNQYDNNVVYSPYLIATSHLVEMAKQGIVTVHTIVDKTGYLRMEKEFKISYDECNDPKLVTGDIIFMLERDEDE